MKMQIYSNMVFNMLDVLSIAIDTGVYSQGKVLNNFFAKLYFHTIGKPGNRLFAVSKLQWRH